MALKGRWPAKDMAKVSVLVVVYFAAAKWGLMLAIVQANATAVWPPTGIAMAVLLLWGLRFWPGVFLGAFFANLTTAGTVWTSLAIASGNTLEALAGAGVMLLTARNGIILERTSDLLRFALVAGGATALSATIGPGSLFLAGMTDGASFRDVWVTWWLGDLTGALLFTPPILLAPRKIDWGKTPARMVEGMAVISLLGVAAWVLYGGHTVLSTSHTDASFVFLPILLWIAVRFSPFISSLSVIFLSLAAIRGTIGGFGPFYELNLNEAFLLLQCFMAVVGLTVLCLALDVSERRVIQEKLREAKGDLQKRVIERTEDLGRANAELERRVQEKGLLEEERRRLAMMVENSLDFICMTDLEGHFTYLNSAGRRLTGLDLDSPIEALIHKDFLAPVDHPRLEQEVLPAIASHGHWEGEFPLRHLKTGETLTLHFNALLIRDPRTGEPQGMAAIARDVRELKRKDEELRRMAFFVESVRDYAIIFLDPLGRIQSWNEGAEHMKGYKAQEVLGRSFSIFYTPEELQFGKPDQLMERAAQDGRAEDEGWRVRADGSRFWAESTLTALRNDQGELQGFVKITRDVTQRRRIEELMRSNQELEQFAYVASHDLQEPLRMVASYVQLLARKYVDRLDADAKTYIEQAVDGAKRMQALINDLLAYSRVGNQPRVFEKVDFEMVLQDALRNLESTVRENKAQITYDHLPVLVGDHHQFLQLVQNLLSNAMKFKGAEPPKIHVSAVEKDQEWLFSVKDNGIGVDPQYVEKIFEVFKRLHTRYEYPGTGIGLAICRKVVNRHGGRIWMESKGGEGATVHWTLPVMKGAALGTSNVG